MGESEEKLKSLLMKVKEESEKADLKLNIKKTKIMASGPITSWQIDVETVADSTVWAPKSLQMVTAAIKLKDACSLEGKLLKSRDILKSRDTSLTTKIYLVKIMVFPVVMYRCENWTINKAECLRTDTFESWCWRRLLRVPWTARQSNQSILKEISPECSLEGPMLKLSLQYLAT